MRILIADPDSAARCALRETLALVADASVVAECGDGREIMPACLNTAADVIFLDTTLPQLAEFYGMYAALDGKPAYLVGLAADEAAAIRALEGGAADFILKPAAPETVKRVFIKLRYLDARGGHEFRARADGRLHETDLNRLLRSAVEHIFGRQRTHEFGKLAVKVGTRTRLLKLMHIMYARAAGDYVDIALSTGERIHTKDQLVNLISRLPALQFVRTHRSFILNREYVKEIRSKNNDYELVLTDDTVITSGSTYRKEIRQQFLLNAV